MVFPPSPSPGASASRSDRSAAPAARVFLRAAEGHAEAVGEAVSAVYDELRRLAGAEARRARGEAFQPTALVHETYLRLRQQRRGGWRDRATFLTVASRVMRNVLVDRAREFRSLRRGGDRVREPLEELRIGLDDQAHGVLEIHDLLERLGETCPEEASTAELFVFGGLNLDAVAEALGLSPRTVDRRWRFARAWLLDQLTEIDRDSKKVV